MSVVSVDRIALPFDSLCRLFYIYMVFHVFLCQALHVLLVEAVPRLVQLSPAAEPRVCILCLSHTVSIASAAGSSVDNDLSCGINSDFSAHATVGAALFYARRGGGDAEYSSG